MPLHIDVRLNDRMLKRLHISRMTHNGMEPDSINEYSVVIADKEPARLGTGLLPQFKDSPEWWEWELSPIRFQHRYGDDELTCLLKALEAVKEHDNKTVGTTV